MKNTSILFLGKKNNLQILTETLHQYYVDRNRKKLKHLKISIEKDISQNPNYPFTRHYFFMTLSTLYHLDFFLATPEQQNELIDYFFNVNYWQFYDLCLMEHVVNMLHVEKMRPYLSDILKQYATESMPKASTEIVNRILINTLETSIIQKKYSFTKYLLNKIAEYHFNSEDFWFQTWLLFWTGVYEKNHNKIRHAYSIPTYLHQNSTLQSFDNFLKITHTDNPFIENDKKNT
ncbi:XRE family transcriptional regulator [Leuconostoc litchii]|uniref:Rgg family transcriptional regulator n=1 Tax=Leuconostoc litchii TaxID=1981069 RepID=UPI003D676C6D